MLTTWLCVGAAVALCWIGRRPLASLLLAETHRWRRPRRVELVTPPNLDRWPELDVPSRDRGLTW